MARMEGRIYAYNFLMENVRERDHLEDLGVDGKQLRAVLKNRMTGGGMALDKYNFGVANKRGN